MLAPTEFEALDCFCTGRKKKDEDPVGHELQPKFVIGLVEGYLNLRRCLLGGDVECIKPSGNRYDLYVVNKGVVASTGFVWGYSGERPGRPVINFTFPAIEQNSADICWRDGFTLNLLFAKQREGMDVSIPQGWK